MGWTRNIAPHLGKSKARQRSEPGSAAAQRARERQSVRSITLSLVLLVQACATSPAVRLDAHALELGLRAGAIQAVSTDGTVFSLRTYANPDLQSIQTAGPGVGRTTRLTIYLDGDGRPFVAPTRVARDPTGQDALTLRLVAADATPAIFVGRPCYHGMTPDCDPRLWTTARYGEKVVSAMTGAIETLLARFQPAEAVLIGYSGGGTLAVLIAERLQSVDAVVTIAANLDLAAWTALHGYSPLSASLDPARLPGLRSKPQLHYAGAQDHNVPPALQAAFAQRATAAEFRTVEGFDHRCCWAESWAERLVEIDAFVRSAHGPP